MKRRTLLASAASAVLAAPLLGTRRVRAATAERRNVLLLISDDQGLDAGCYGTGIVTPRIDALARGGTRFTQAFAAVSSCSPSRSVIYTGLYSHSNGMYGLAHDVHNQSLLDGIETLPQLLKRAGYATALVGKKHVRPDSAFVYDAELAPEQSGIRDVAFMAEEALRFVRSTERPFFVTVAYSDPHRAPVNYGNNRAWPRVEPVRYDPARVPLPAHLPDLPEVRRDLADYYESVSRLDTGIGLLLDGLRETGHADDTLVIYLSDNGRPFPGAKTNLYDPGLHLPLIVHAPGVAGDAVNDSMVSFIDIVPTILDWTRAAAPARPLPGRSLFSLLGKSGAANGWDRVFASHDFHEINQYYPMRSVRTKSHSYILNIAHPLEYPIAGDVAGSPSWKAISARADIRLGGRTQAAYLKRPVEELYDLRNDPQELVNLATEPRAATILAEHRQQLLTFRRDTRDPWLAGQTSPYHHEAR